MQLIFFVKTESLSARESPIFRAFLPVSMLARGSFDGRVIDIQRERQDMQNEPEALRTSRSFCILPRRPAGGAHPTGATRRPLDSRPF